MNLIVLSNLQTSLIKAFTYAMRTVVAMLGGLWVGQTLGYGTLGALAIVYIMAEGFLLYFGEKDVVYLTPIPDEDVEEEEDDEDQ